jgi:hypothetical protein
MVLETLVLSTFNHLTRLLARENFIILSRRESLKSYIINFHSAKYFSFTDYFAFNLKFGSSFSVYLKTVVAN